MAFSTGRECRMAHKHGWLRVSVLGVSLGALVAGTACAAPMVGLDGFIGELAACWRPHIALGVAACSAMVLAARCRILAGLLEALVVTLGTDVIRMELASVKAEAGSGMQDRDAVVRAYSSTSSSSTTTSAGSLGGSRAAIPTLS